MRYEIGKMFECEIEQSKPLTPIDYLLPTEKENQKYLNLLNTEIIKEFEEQVVRKREERKQYENHFKRLGTE